MALYFLDGKLIAPNYYYTEPGSTWVRSIIDNKANVCLISEISLPIVAAALSQLYKNQHFNQPLLEDAFQRFEDDIANGIFVSQLLTTDILYRAALLTLHYSLKADDAIQLASALVTQETLTSTLTFVSSDKTVLEASSSLSLKTENPFDHVMPEDQQR